MPARPVRAGCKPAFTSQLPDRSPAGSVLLFVEVVPVPIVTLQLFTGPVTVTVERGELLLEGVRRRGVQLSFQCREATCAKCRVRVLAGRENMSEPGRKERDRLGDHNIAAGLRLACQAQVYGDVEVSQ